MPAFVFQFGYHTPDDHEANNAGIDFESNEWVVIDAPDKAAALEWGCAVAERFVSQTYGVSWQAKNFAHWVEPLAACPWATGRPIVRVGEYPDFTR
jgi:hypothetical protein